MENYNNLYIFQRTKLYMMDKRYLLDNLHKNLKDERISNWEDIDSFLEDLRKAPHIKENLSKNEFHQKLTKGVAFITFDFGIDGVSIEIFKYAQCLEKMFSSNDKNVPLHFIGGDFHDKADVVLKSHWNRYQIEGINGWSKWDDGIWFSKLFYEEMPEDSEVSNALAVEMWEQACNFASKLGEYLIKNDISLLIPVNIPSNPGNFANMLAMAIVTEALGIYVISSNHDYYWEGGKALSKKATNEAVGPRDHFFKNIDNKSFYNVFEKLFPWNGKRWVFVNINTLQTEVLTTRFGFDKSKVFELGTSISNDFFAEFDAEDQSLSRKKMAYILSDGQSVLKTTPISDHLKTLKHWMTNQHPLICSFKEETTIDITASKTIYCLQPTRVVGRKRIEMDLSMLEALMQHPSFKSVFENDKDYRLVLHITGPVPIEHQADLEVVLKAYLKLCESIAHKIANRIFIAFSVGTEDHPSLKANNLTPLNIEQIYRMATVILFPSQTEGRGLPIIESSAVGIPIICSRYFPEEVFAEVVGEGLPEEQQIKYLLFPEGDYSAKFLDSAAELMLYPEKSKDLMVHNKKAVRSRYSIEMITEKFNTFIEALRTIN